MNVCTFYGNLTRDSEMRQTGFGPALTFGIANNIGFGEKQKVNFVNCTLWGEARAAKLQPMLMKGQPVMVSGELVLNQWVKETGETASSLELRVSDVKLAGGARQDQGQQSYQPAAPQRQAPAQYQQRQAPAQYQQQPQKQMTDDIPF